MSDNLTKLLKPLRKRPEISAILLDIDGTLAPIVKHAEDAYVSENTRKLVAEIASRYALVACISGRRAAEARRLVAIGAIAYLGNHGNEIIHPEQDHPELNPEIEKHTQAVQEFIREHHTPALGRLRIRTENKGPIVSLHWRGAPDEAAAEAAVMQLIPAIQTAGLAHKQGRKVLEVRPPNTLDKGAAVVRLLRGAGSKHAVYIGDDETDLDAFHGLDELQASNELTTAVRIGVRSAETPAALQEAADELVTGPEGVQTVLRILLS